MFNVNDIVKYNNPAYDEFGTGKILMHYGPYGYLVEVPTGKGRTGGHAPGEQALNAPDATWFLPSQLETAQDDIICEGDVIRVWNNQYYSSHTHIQRTRPPQQKTERKLFKIVDNKAICYVGKSDKELYIWDNFEAIKDTKTVVIGGKSIEISLESYNQLQKTAGKQLKGLKS